MILTMDQRRGLNGRDSILRHIARTGNTIAGDPVWTAMELDILRRLYPDREAIIAALPRRTEGAIAHKARQIGLVPPLQIWSDNDATKLRRPYVAGVAVGALAEMFPGKTPQQIWGKASAMGYRRPRRSPQTTGMPLVDSIRLRAFELRISMTELDAFVGKKRYFVGVRHVDWRALQSAMTLLGGKPVVHWRET